MSAWIKAAGARALKTVFQTAAATAGTGQMMDSVSVKTTIVTALGAGFLSLLTSLAGLPEVKAKNSDKM